MPDQTKPAPTPPVALWVQQARAKANLERDWLYRTTSPEGQRRLLREHGLA